MKKVKNLSFGASIQLYDLLEGGAILLGLAFEEAMVRAFFPNVVIYENFEIESIKRFI